MGDLIFPCDTEYALEASDVEALETPNMPAVGSPSFCTKQQGGNTDCLVDSRFGESTEIFISKDFEVYQRQRRGDLCVPGSRCL